MSVYLDELNRIVKQQLYEPELNEAVARVLVNDLTDELQMEALRRVRKRTHSLLLQGGITNALKDGWVAAEDNSEVQPYKGR